MSRATDIAWAAGLFEGEGCIYLQKRQGGPSQPQLILNMCDEDVVRRFADVVGGGSIREYEPENPKHSRQYRWRLCSWGEVGRVLDLLGPHLGKRRSEQVARFEAARDEKRKGHQPKKRCVNGHEMTPENTRINKQGHNNGVHRKCRACDREAQVRMRNG